MNDRLRPALERARIAMVGLGSDVFVYAFLWIAPLALVAFGFLPKEHCETRLCRDLATQDANKIVTEEWPYSAVDKTSPAKAVPIQQILEMIEREQFSKERLRRSPDNPAEIIRFRKWVREYFLLYIPIQSDELVLDLVITGDSVASLRAARLRSEGIGNL